VAGARAWPIRHASDKQAGIVPRLDTTMLGGGYYRAASILITSFPARRIDAQQQGAFAGRPASVVSARFFCLSFDSDAGEVVRNLTSVNIQLART